MRKEKTTILPLKERWKIIFKYLAPYKKELRFLSVIGVISAVTGGLVPYVIGRFLDTLVHPSNINLFGWQISGWLVFLSVFATTQLINDFSDWFITKRASYLAINIHSKENANGYAFLLTLPLSFHKNSKPGEISEIIWKSADLLANLSEHILIRLAPQFLSIIVGIAIAWYLNVYLSLVLIAGIIFYCMLLTRVVTPLALATSEGQKKWGEAHGYSTNINSNVLAVKQAGGEIYEKKQLYKKWVDVAAIGWAKVESIWSNVSYIQNLIVTITRITIFLASVYFISKGALTLGELIAFNGYAMMVFGPFAILGRNWATVENALSAVSRAEEIFKLAPEAYGAPGRVSVRGETSIEFKNVHFRYKPEDPQVLKNISFSVKSGEMIALVGKTGVGKSTLIDLISGYYFPTKGSVFIDGHNTRDINLKDLRAHIAVVPQETPLFNDTISNNIKYGSFEARDKKVKEAAKLAHVDEFVKKFPQKYEQEVGHRGVKLSVGQKQRVAIARAMLRDPSIIILDEPTSALDSVTEKYVTESLEKLMKGRTTFVIAHRLSTVRKADRIFFIENGEIIEKGSHNELIKIQNGKYKEMHDLHIGLRE